MAKEKSVVIKGDDIITPMATERKIKLEEFLGSTESRLSGYSVAILRQCHTKELHTMKEWEAVATADMEKPTNPVRPQITKE